MMTVLFVAIRPLVTDDVAALCECEVIDQATGAIGTIILSDFKIRDLLGDCPTSDLVDVDPDRIVWTNGAS
jgi:hypothetical protein